MNIQYFTEDPLFILAIGILVVFVSIIGFRLHAFLALLLGAFVVALITPEAAILLYQTGKGVSEAAAQRLADQSEGIRIATEFGNTCGKIGILIAMASIIGKTMLESGAAEKIVRSTLKITGDKYAPMTFLGSSFFIGIPVFFDTVFYLMVPLAKAMAMRVGKNYGLLILCIAAGAAMANSLVPPTPGPLFLVTEMNIPIGMMMMGGFLVGLVTISAGYLYAVWANRKWPIPLRDAVDAPLDEIKTLSEKDERELPALWFSLLPIVIPIVLISVNALIGSFVDVSKASSSWLTSVLDFIGEKNVALSLGALSSIWLLAVQKKGDKKGLTASVQTALMSAGVIILITSAGGAFGGMLQQTGISLRLAELTKDYQMALIPLAFFITAIVRTAQGSATVAMITASGILAGMANAGTLEYHQLYLGLAIACGSKLIPWMNDSGFWIVCKMSNLTEQEALKTFSPLLTIMGLVGLIVILIAASIFPLI
ncbi:Gluconate:H+ symporter, GntP family [Imperialibacter sp. EC-SDR9]|nr:MULTISPECIES: SLC13 family permease [unclassified Imperialibacter]CAD5252754.1 Gluconate:H+ symporter, GntP family [Imperialibacter sp. 89]CAD5260896.1 Gluconate:H+ symporter, GntP family [Imperialibacter sp. 75]VVT03874.1 Gluconate:H+ symporter, GntP family [Imperialibacter sp. EC-SDR9]